ncbi:MAG: CDC48 family AAA ATPase [Verrucomicrobia bacterium]|nr:CDC48 family AAA ATPase [Verrucomicrobiota bacterium]
MPNTPPTLTRTTTEAASRDVGRGIARLDPEDLAQLGIEVGDLLELKGRRTAAAKAMPTYPEHRGKGQVQVDGLLRENAGCALGDELAIGPTEAGPATQITLAPIDRAALKGEADYVASVLDGLPVQKGDRVRATLFGSRWLDFTVVATRPKGLVMVQPDTQLVIEEGDAKTATGRAPGTITYEDIGGLGRQLERVREMIELPLRHPEVFTRLGIDPPKGVLLCGPPGTGKTLIARAVARETDASFHAVGGPEVINKLYGESEAAIRKIFDEAARQPPAIIFIDEIDSIAPKRERAVGDVEKRVVAQLLSLMDGLKQRGQLLVIAATNLPDSLDPALRRPGRFDRELHLPIPDRIGRREILEIHSRGMPLDDNVDTAHLAGITHGYVGADIASLCREAAMCCLREVMPDLDVAARTLTASQLDSLTIRMEHFQSALSQIAPSAIREVFTEIPSVTWDDVGGLDEIKQALTEAVVWPINHPEYFEQARIAPPRGLLLCGPPGTGKTLLARALAAESRVNFIAIKGPQLLSMYVGESERAVREVFHKARLAAPCLLFFDELDALTPRRDTTAGNSQVTERVVGQFLSEMDGVEALRGVFILGATNRADLIDPALRRPGRFDRTLELPLPDEAALHAIYRIHTRDKPLASGVKPEKFAAASTGLTGADIEGLCRRAAMTAVQRAVAMKSKKTRVEVRQADLQAALDAAKADNGLE